MKKHIDIEGMSCEHCANAIRNALNEIGGKDIQVDHIAGYAEVDIDADDSQIAEIIGDEGFEVTKITQL